MLKWWLPVNRRTLPRICADERGLKRSAIVFIQSSHKLFVRCLCFDLVNVWLGERAATARVAIKDAIRCWYASSVSGSFAIANSFGVTNSFALANFFAVANA